MRKPILTCIGVGLAVLSFFIGRWWGGASATEKLMQEEMIRYGKFANLDRTVLQGFPARSNAMTSGTYLMEVWFPDGAHPSPHEVKLRCENGKIVVPATNSFTRSGGPLTLSVTGNVVSWTEEGALYEANPEYVGLIDGGEMWGRVYGWNPGDQSVGIWRMYPKPYKTGLPSATGSGR